MKENLIISSLLQLLEESFHKQSWHGTNLRGSIRGLSLEQASWRPSPKRHNIWEIVVHCAYWKYTVRRRLTGEKRGSFPLNGSNFFFRPTMGTKEEWKKDVRLLEEMHFLLLEKIKTLSENELKKHTRESKFNTLQTITGIASHDVYHAGQIQFLTDVTQNKNLWKYHPYGV